MRLFRQDVLRQFYPLCLLVLVTMVSGCFTDTPPAKPAPPHDATQDPLRVGDRIKVELSGTPDTFQPIEQDIHEDGSINLPYIGRVVASGVSPSKLEQQITTNYVPRYFTHITVTVTPTARFFYVGGQVNNNAGGRIQWVGPITVMGAIQAAGDFTPFANRKDVQITRANGVIEHVNCVQAIKHPEKDVPIYPGDRIWVERRYL